VLKKHKNLDRKLLISYNLQGLFGAGSTNQAIFGAAKIKKNIYEPKLVADLITFADLFYDFSKLQP
jgi:hypothetical protein